MKASREIEKSSGKSSIIASKALYLSLHLMQSEGKRKSRRGREL